MKSTLVALVLFAFARVMEVTVGAVVSTMKECVVSALVLPAASVALTFSSILPTGKETEGSQDQTPDPFTGTSEQISARLYETSTELLASAVPLIVGVTSLVDPVGALTTGAAGGVRSNTVKECVVSLLVLPAPSVALTVSWMAPSGRVDDTQDQAPDP